MMLEWNSLKKVNGEYNAEIKKLLYTIDSLFYRFINKI